MSADASDIPRQGLLARLKAGLSRTSSALSDGVASLLTKRKLDAAAIEDLEDLLISADLGVAAAGRIAARLKANRYDKDIEADAVRLIIADEIASALAPLEKPLLPDPARKPHVVLVVGVNGGGKTTTIGKLARIFRDEGHTVMLAAGDTFRAAAIEQLKLWGERAGASVIAGKSGADASGLVHDAMTRARVEGADVLLIDTAGRLQNKANLMAELAKIVRVIKKVDASAPHDTVLVLDATTGQNVLRQIEIFREVAAVSGLIMTKLDGTARGGVLVATAEKFALPIHAIGVGEGAADLQPFEAVSFARAIAGLEP